jgi:hypothetical protein
MEWKSRAGGIKQAVGFHIFHSSHLSFGTYTYRTKLLGYAILNGSVTSFWRYNPVWVLAASIGCSFEKGDFSGLGLLASRPAPQTEGPGTILHLASTIGRVWHRGFYQQMTLPPA